MKPRVVASVEEYEAVEGGICLAIEDTTSLLDQQRSRFGTCIHFPYPSRTYVFHQPAPWLGR